ncbi:MAG: DUF4011 domain-containing protein, partial [Bacteroidota bacterium]
MEELVERSIEKLRQRLLDLSNRNRLLNYKHSDRARTHIRIIDELPDVLYERLKNDETLSFKALPEPEDEPKDEHTNQFLMRLEQARMSDAEYGREIQELGEEDDGSSKKAREIERRLKDRVRDVLGMPARKSLEIMSIAEFARRHGLDPSYDMPEPHSSGEDPERRTDKYIQTLLLREDMNRKLSSIRNKARSGLQETGVNTLYFAFGFLQWHEVSSERDNFAPLLLYPIEMDRRLVRNRYEYIISSIGEEMEINLTLSERLARDFGLTLPQFDEDDTLERYFANVEELIQEQSRWRLRRFVTIGHFAFARLIMYHDLDQGRWEHVGPLKNHDVISKLLVGSSDSDPIFADEYDIDVPKIANKVPILVADADSSQHSALIDAVSGKNLVIEGPPGTGKSQTIVNLIAAALASEKRVLFIAEKMAALEVVKNRLDHSGLGDFCLELHSTKARKRDVLESLENRLNIESRGGRVRQRYERARGEFEVLEGRLRKYVDTLNQRFGKLDKTIQEIIWAEINSREKPPDPPPDLNRLQFENAQNISTFQAQSAKERLRNLGALDADFRREYGSLNDHPWFGVKNYELSHFEMEDLQYCISEAHTALAALRDEIQSCQILLGFGPGGSLGEVQIFLNRISKLSLSPEKISTVIFANLAMSEMRDACKDFVTSILCYREALDDLRNKLDVTEEDLAEQATRLRGCIEMAEPLNIGNLARSDCPSTIDGLRTSNQNFSQVAEFTSALSKRFQIDPLPTAQVLEILLKAYECISKIDAISVRLRSPEVLDSANRPQLETGSKECERLAKVRVEISKLLRLSTDLSPTMLTEQAITLRDAGLFSKMVSSAYRAARRSFRAIYLGDTKIDPQNMASLLFRLAEHLEETTNFNTNSHQQAVCGSFFAGIETPYDKLLNLNDWASDVRITFSDSNPIERAACDLLISGSTQDVEAVLAVCKNANLALALETLSSVRGSSEEDFSVRARAAAHQADEMERLDEESKGLGLHDHIRFEQFEGILQGIVTADESRKSAGNNDIVRKILGDEFDGINTDIGPLTTALAFAEDIVDAGFGEPFEHFLITRQVGDRWADLSNLVRRLLEKSDQLSRLSHQAIKVGQIDEQVFFGAASLAETPFESLHAKLQGCLSNPRSLVALVNFLRGKTEVDEPSLAKVIECYDVGGQPLENLESAYDQVLYRSIARETYEAHPVLNKFSGLSQQEARIRFQEVDHQILELSRDYLAGELSSRHIEPGVGLGLKRDFTDRELILHELSKKKRHIPLRDLLNRAGVAIQQMKPCFMMSPLSVAQFLKPGRLQFDLLIVDEASQMRPEFALGAIARANQIVVVGDPKQLPPTSFFDRLDETDEIDEIEEGVLSESILDMGLTVFRPARRLRWHYRSQHESLIAFSNKEFYRGELVVFPSPYEVHPEYGVSLVKVNGHYRGRVNVPEAQAITKAASKFMRSRSNLSLGIAALNQSQRDLIVDEMDRIFARDRDCEDYRMRWDGTLYPFFVKNLENVQGDERDVIFISTVYGPDDSGRVLQRFGPINHQTGHRRLNVLYTRAKKRVVVFSSMNPGDIRVAEDSSRGVRALRGYLEFATTGRLEAGEVSDREPDSDFEIWVMEKLEQFGYEVVPQVGVSGFFIDLAVRHPDQSGTFILGIECDGATYHSSRSSRDRDRLRQEVLEGLGWEIHRIWSTDWFRDPLREVQKVHERIEELRAQVIPAQLTPFLDLGETPGGERRIGQDPELMGDAYADEADEVNRDVPPDPDSGPSDVVTDSAEDGETAETKKELIEGGVESEAVVELGDTVIYFEVGRPDRSVSVTIVSGPSNPRAGIIDRDTPVARALLGLAEGEPGELITPAGAKQIKVISIDKSPFPSSTEPEERTRQVLADNTGFANAETQTFQPEDPVQPYENWQSRRLPDPKSATPAEVLRGILDIVKAEGPIMVNRVYQLYAKSAGISRVGKAVRLALNQALTVAVRQGMIVVDDELSSRDRLSSVARLPDTPPIVPRTLGDRSLDQVPPSEIAHVMRSIQTQESRINREALYREVLDHYGLRRMTQHVFTQLSRVCSELLSEDETSQLAGP